MNKVIFAMITVIIFIYLTVYLFLPTFSYGFFGLPSIVLLSGVILILFDFNYEYESLNNSFLSKIGFTFIILSSIFIFILPIFSAKIFNVSEYQTLIGNIEEKTFSSDISPTNPNDIIIIDYNVARKLADKKLVSENLALGSQTSIGGFTLQKVNNSFYYVAPLNHSGYFKWRRNKKGTPGYMLVNANNDKDVQLISNINGEDIFLKYQSGAYFSSFINRHVYKNGYRNVAFADPKFEIDDNMKPWYIFTLYEKTIAGYGGKNATGVLTVCPQTGEIYEYDIKDAPEWIDRIQPEKFILTQFNNWGTLLHGVFNFSNKDKRVLSDGVQLVYGDDGVCYLYSGVTSVGSDNASMGFILTNSRDKSTTFFKSTGAIERAIQRSAEQKISEKGYVAGFPRPYNINGQWTYVLPLIDTEGLIKAIAMVNYENYQIVGIGMDNNIMEALRNYRSALNNRGNVIVLSSDNDLIEISGKIIRLNNIPTGNINYLYFMLDTQPNKLFVTTSTISNEVFITKIGDNVKLKLKNIDESEVFVDAFDNLEINFHKTNNLIDIENKFNIVDDRLKSKDLDNRIKSMLEDMSDEEKRQLLN